jgi:hypothetical protein
MFLVFSLWIYTLVLVFGARLGYDSYEVVMLVTSCLIYESFGITCPCVCIFNLWSVCLFYENPWYDHILYISIMICMNCLWHPMNFLCLYNLYSGRTVHRVSVFLASDMVRYCPYHIFGVSDVVREKSRSDCKSYLINHSYSLNKEFVFLCWCVIMWCMWRMIVWAAWLHALLPDQYQYLILQTS